MKFFVCAVVLILHTNAKRVRPTRQPPFPPREDYFGINADMSYNFGYKTNDAGRHQHAVSATADNTVSGRYSHIDPSTGGDVQTVYTAGPRGFRARGPHIARKMDLAQGPPLPYHPPVHPDSPQYNPSWNGYFDPNEDPSYEFQFRTPDHTRKEGADKKGDVNGRFSFLDDVGSRHVVEYEAGSRTGFHVKSPVPDSEPFSSGLPFQGPSKGDQKRGHSSVLRGKDGSYSFSAVGPDHRRSEVKDASGHVRGSYTYIDDKGVQRTTDYIAGPNIGYKVINAHKNPDPPVFPYFPPPSFPTFTPAGSFTPGGNKDEDIFGSGGFDSGEAGIGPGKDKNKPRPGSGGISTGGGSSGSESEEFDHGGGSTYKPGGEDYKPGGSGGYKPGSSGGGYKPGGSGGYKPGGSGGYKPGTGSGSKPGGSTGGYKPGGGGKPWKEPGKPGFGGGSDGNDDIFGPNLGGGSPLPDGDDYDTSHGVDGDDDNFLSGDQGFGGSSEQKDKFMPTTFRPSPGWRPSRPPPTRPSGRPSGRPTGRPSTSRPSYGDCCKGRPVSEGEDGKFLGFPPGVAVRAHVQSLDILPIGSKRFPSPSVALEEYVEPLPPKKNRRLKSRNDS